MKYINCSREKYINLQSRVIDREYLEERKILAEFTRHKTKAGRALFNYVEDGRIICLTVFFDAVRAHQRGKLTLRTLPPQQRIAGDRCTKRVPYTAEQRAAALAEQGAILAEVMHRCPRLFDGILEVEEPYQPPYSGAAGPSLAST